MHIPRRAADLATQKSAKNMDFLLLGLLFINRMFLHHRIELLKLKLRAAQFFHIFARPNHVAFAISFLVTDGN